MTAGQVLAVLEGTVLRSTKGRQRTAVTTPQVLVATARLIHHLGRLTTLAAELVTEEGLAAGRLVAAVVQAMGTGLKLRRNAVEALSIGGTTLTDLRLSASLLIHPGDAASTAPATGGLTGRWLKVAMIITLAPNALTV